MTADVEHYPDDWPSPGAGATARAAPSSGDRRRVALVLSGGGARGAYAVGVTAGLHDILGDLGSRIGILTGTSVGAINAAHFAAHADSPDMGVADLTRQWSELRLKTHLRPRVSAFLRWARWREQAGGRPHPSGARSPEVSLLDPRPFERMVERLPWERLHRNVSEGLVRALIVPILRIRDGRTVTFAELAPGANLAVTRDPRRHVRLEPITANHVLASAALPFLFPPRLIHGSYHCDGGLRFNTPMAPALRAGADRLVVVSLRTGTPPLAPAGDSLEPYPSPIFLLGKVLDALLLDPIDYDLHVLERLNRMLEAMDESVPAEAAERVHRALEGERGLGYAKIATLVFRPSEDIGVMAGEYLRSSGPARCEAYAARLLLRYAVALGGHVEADVASYLLFDGGFARLLIDLGRRDVLARANEVRAFFASKASLREAHSQMRRARNP